MFFTVASFKIVKSGNNQNDIDHCVYHESEIKVYICLHTNMHLIYVLIATAFAYS